MEFRLFVGRFGEWLVFRAVPVQTRVAFLLIFVAILTLTDERSGGGEPEKIVVHIADDFEQLVGELKQPVVSDLPGRTFARTVYPEQQAIEWQIRLTPNTDTVFSDLSLLQSADLTLDFDNESEITLIWSEGSHAQPSDFKPNTEKLTQGKVVSLKSFGGRSSDGVMPFFQVSSDQGGVILAVGWSGDWKADFEMQGNGQVAFRTGLQRAGFALKANQEVRLPSILLMRYNGSSAMGINQFRRLMLRQFSPRHLTTDETMPMAASVHGMLGFNDTDAVKLGALAQDIGKLELPLDTFWLDAGWNEGGFPAKQGNTMPDATRFPQGLREIGQWTELDQKRFLLWFEPERVMRDTEVMRDHPEWLLRPVNTPPELRYQENDGFYLFDLGNESARQWMLERISAQISEYGVDVYRQDCNLYPAYFWGNAYADDASVSSEVEYVTGLYAFLDDLQRRHPQLLIDNCASGGRRVDFEMLRRSVLLWRSDCTWGDVSAPRNMQAMTYGLSYWLPLHGLGAVGTDPMSLRSGMGYCASYAIQYRDQNEVQRLRAHLDSFVKVRKLFSADFYPLTPWSLDVTQPIGWQFHDPDKGQGIVQLFCDLRQVGKKEIRLLLSGLEALETYELKDWDDGKSLRKTGQEWGGEGILLDLVGGEEIAKVYEYRKVEGE